MWTKKQLWQNILALSGLLLVAASHFASYRYGWIILAFSIPLLIVGFAVNRMLNRSLQVSNEQAKQASRHVEELSHYIAEQERSAKILKESEEKFRNAFDYASIGMAMVSPQSDIRKVNRAFADMLGFTSEELSKLNYRTIIVEDDVETLDMNLASLLNGTVQSCEMEQRAVNSLGETLWLHWSSSIIGDTSGESSNFIFQVQDITDRKRAEQRLVHDALHDALTGLPNRVLFLDRLHVSFNRAQRHFDNYFTVLFLDFDRFKLVNDSFGHITGDKLLIEISTRLQNMLRSSDTVARLGGDEFAMLVDEIANIDEALPIVDRILGEMKKPFDIEGKSLYATVSIGIAAWSRDYASPDLLLRDADTALYQAKSMGRDRYEIFDDDMHAKAFNLLQMETDLRHALEQNQFCVFYQPIIKLKTGTLSGFEALIRWNHPIRGMISPMEFIPVAEETGLILPIGEWILGEACRQLKIWQAKPGYSTDLWVSVNVSSKQFLKPDFVRTVIETLEISGLHPASLKLEITESAMVENIDYVVSVMEELKSLGVMLSIDDFGTGYASLSNLHKLPLSSLKIDRSFVREIHSSIENDEIVETIVKLAKSLDLEIIAEGIETQEQLLQLKDLSCQMGQGFYFARPLDVTGVETMLENRMICDQGETESIKREIASLSL